MQTVPHSERVGYYLVNNEKYDNKWDAMLSATAQNTDYSWYFAPEVFDKIDWSTPVDLSLDQLYAVRLQQLRNKYEHLVLFFSGGKDSLNILLTAINNNILLDEIVVFYPFAMEKFFNNKELDSDNVYSEVEFAAKPLLKSLESRLDTRTKIRFQDNGDTNNKFHQNADWFDEIRPANTLQMISPSYGGAFDPELIKLALQCKKVGVIVGADKPSVFESEGNYYFKFMDVAFNTIPRPKSKEMRAQYEFINYEAFYQTPDLPELVVKQAQTIAQALDIDPKLRSTQPTAFPVGMNKWEVTEIVSSLMSERERLMAQYLYSDNIYPWQTKKHKKHLYRRGEKVVWQTMDNSAKDNYWNGVSSVVKQIDKKFFAWSDYVLGPVPRFSKPYFLKPVQYKEIK